MQAELATHNLMRQFLKELVYSTPFLALLLVMFLIMRRMLLSCMAALPLGTAMVAVGATAIHACHDMSQVRRDYCHDMSQARRD
jgi:hypothetical protein